jgi:hypothetical protein
VVFPWSTWAMIAMLRRGRMSQKSEKFQHFNMPDPAHAPPFGEIFGRRTRR